MSGHSKWATIHRQKEVKDAARGQLFSKLARSITIAAKVGGGPNLDSNYKLKIAVDKARAASMPKENIERAISKAEAAGELVEVLYEGFGPNGVSILVEAATNNRNRTAQEIKAIFEKSGGSLAGPGAVSFNFEAKEQIFVKKQIDSEKQILSIIDLGVDDVEVKGDDLEIYTDPAISSEIKKKIEALEMQITSSDLVRKPKNIQNIEEVEVQQKIMDLLEKLSGHEDVQKVFANI